MLHYEEGEIVGTSAWLVTASRGRGGILRCRPGLPLHYAGADDVKISAWLSQSAGEKGGEISAWLSHSADAGEPLRFFPGWPLHYEEGEVSARRPG